MSTSNEVAAMRLALEALKTAQNNLAPSKHSAHVYGDGELWDEYDEAINALEEALASEQEQRSVSEQLGEPVALESAPENSLPAWSECNLIIQNDDFRKRAEAGLEGQVLDTPRTTPVPTELHRFIHEYDDADPYRSAWFLHRLECVLKESTTPYVATQRQQRTAAEGEDTRRAWVNATTWRGLTDEEMYLNCPNWLSQEHCKVWIQQIEAKLKENNNGSR